MGRGRVISAKTKQERAKRRKAIGRLKDVVVTPVTLNRYKVAMVRLFTWMTWFSVSFPSSAIEADEMGSEYIEYLWESGDPIQYGNDVISALQHYFVFLKRQMNGSWRLLKAWQRHELPARAPPFPPNVVLGMIGVSLASNAWDVAVLLGIGFLAFMRTGELFGLKKKDIKIAGQKIIISLMDTKTSIRKKAYEVVVIESAFLASILQIFLAPLQPHDLLLRRSPANARALFKSLLKFLNLESFEFQWYSLRRGGAAWAFQQHGIMEKILQMGRWESTKTARVYVNDSLASSVFLKLTQEQNNTLATAALLGVKTFNAAKAR